MSIDNVVDDVVDNSVDNLDEEVKFVPLVVDNDYEIATTYPFVIRRRDNGFIPNEFIDKTTGYVRIVLNNKTYYKHLLIVNQFLYNDYPEHKTQCDHINHDRTDYHLKNFRWIAPSNNCKNRTKHSSIC